MALRHQPIIPAPDADPDARAREVEQKMTDDERFSLIVSVMGAVPGIVERDRRIPEDVKNMSAGYTPGVSRLGIPPIQSSDASMGVTNPGYRPDDKGATAFPASIAVGSSFNPQLARECGAAIGKEARMRGFNDPRLLARFDGKSGKWSIADGIHKVALGKSAGDLVLTGEVRLSARKFGA